MPALAASDVTATVEERTIVGRRRRNRVKITFGDGALTYPSGGVPMPGASSFGMVRNLDYLTLFDADDASGIVWKYDKENNKLRGYLQGIKTGAAGVGVLDDFPLDTTDDPLATAVSIGLTAGAAVAYLGKLRELATTHAPAAHTLYAEAVGW